MRLLRQLIAAVVFTGLAGPALGATTPPASTAPRPAPAAVSPAEAATILDTARGRVAAGDTKGAIDGLSPYVAAHPEDAAAGRLLGDLYFRIPDYPRAERVWKAVIALSPDDHEAHSRLGSLYAVEDRVNESIAEFQQSLPNRNGFIGLVLAHKRAGDLPAYLSTLQLAAEKAPFDAAAWADLGQARRALREYPAALEAFNRAAGLRPGSCAARLDLANVLVDLHRPDPAIDNLKACLRTDPSFYPAVVNLGEAYLEKNDVAAARPYLDHALTLKPEGPEALVDIGYIYDLQGDWKTAVTYYNRAIRSDPLRPEAYIDLGYDYNEHRYFPLAEAAFLKGISVAADDGRLHYLLAATYNVQGKIELARTEYHRAISCEEPDVVHAAQRELALLPPS